MALCVGSQSPPFAPSLPVCCGLAGPVPWATTPRPRHSSGAGTHSPASVPVLGGLVSPELGRCGRCGPGNLFHECAPRLARGLRCVSAALSRADARPRLRNGDCCVSSALSLPGSGEGFGPWGQAEIWARPGPFCSGPLQRHHPGPARRVPVHSGGTPAFLLSCSPWPQVVVAGVGRGAWHCLLAEDLCGCQRRPPPSSFLPGRGWALGQLSAAPGRVGVTHSAGLPGTGLHILPMWTGDTAGQWQGGRVAGGP